MTWSTHTKWNCSTDCVVSSCPPPPEIRRRCRLLTWCVTSVRDRCVESVSCRKVPSARCRCNLHRGQEFVAAAQTTTDHTEKIWPNLGGFYMLLAYSDRLVAFVLFITVGIELPMRGTEAGNAAMPDIKVKLTSKCSLQKLLGYKCV